MDELETIFSSLLEVVEDPSFPTVRRWSEEHSGAGVVGHFQVYFPEELVHAAGMLPVKILGAGGQIEAKQADARLGSFICSICKTTLELGLSGRLDFLSAFYTMPICDAARSLAGIWGKNFPFQRGGILYLPQNTRSAASLDYLAAEYRRLKVELEEVSGRTITDDDIRASIRVFNMNRRLLRELYALRRRCPWLISLVELYVLMRAGAVLPREEHNTYLRRVLELLPNRPSHRKDKIRVVFEGGFCEQPPIDMLRTLEDTAYVVDDDLLIGMRWILDDVPEDAPDPIRALAEAYIENSSYSPVQRDPRKPKEEMLLARCREAGAEAVIVAAAKMCEPGLDEQVTYARALERAGLPYLILEFEGKETAFEHMRMQLETFAESILFD